MEDFKKLTEEMQQRERALNQVKSECIKEIETLGYEEFAKINQKSNEEFIKKYNLKAVDGSKLIKNKKGGKNGK